MVTSHSLTWQGATVVDTQPVTDRIQRIVFRPDDVQRIEPGAHVEVRLLVDAEPVTRSYSIAEPLGADGSFALCIHRSDVSRGGAAAMHSLAPGDRVELTHPLQDFPFSYGGRRYAFLAGGVGITAVRSMMTAARLTGKEYRSAYCGRSRSQMAYLDALQDEHGDALRVHIGDEGCRKGVCGICQARVVGLEGGIDHRDVFYSERQRNANSKLCPCVSRVRPAAEGEIATI